MGRAFSRRGRRCPVGAHAGAVGAARRLRCGARPGVASHNSLRSLRSLRSDRCAESDNEARCARRARPCAAPRPRNRPCRTPPAAPWNQWCSRCIECKSTPDAAAKARAGRLRRAFGGAEERRARGPRAQRATTSDSPHLSERSERSERSELCGGATRPSTAGQSVRSTDRLREAPRACPHAPLPVHSTSPRRKPIVRNGQQADLQRPASFHASRVARSTVEQLR